MGQSLEARLAREALTMAVIRRQPGEGLLHHSDRGVQYASEEYQELLTGRKDDLFDEADVATATANAVMESFWGSLKTEWAFHEHYATRQRGPEVPL